MVKLELEIEAASEEAVFGDALANKLLAEIAAASQTPRQVARAVWRH